MDHSSDESTLVKMPAVSKKLRVYQAKCGIVGGTTNDFGTANMLIDIGKPFGNRSIQTKGNLPCLASSCEGNSNATFLRTSDDIKMLLNGYLVFGSLVVSISSDSISWRCLPDKGGPK